MLRYNQVVDLQRLENLVEAQLREDVLIPLFRAMGFKDVVHWHGGSMEQGKDIVMWKNGDLGERVNYAVVVLAEKVSGQATGAGSAAKVATQIQQAFSSQFRDAVSGSSQVVERVWVVSSHPIRKEAQESIENIIQQSRLHLLTSYISGDTLCLLIEKHLPTTATFAQLHKAVDHFQNADPNFAVGILASKGKKHFWLESKTSEAGSLPPKIKFKIKYDNSEEAKFLQAEVEKNLKAGEGIVVPGKYISNVEAPDVLKPFFQNISSLSIQPKLAKGKLLIRLELLQKEEQPFLVHGLELTQARSGADQIVLNNEDSISPWKFELVLHPSAKQASFSFRFEMPSLTATKQLEGWKMTRALARASSIRIIDAMTGLLVLERPVKDNDPKPEEGDPILLETLEKLSGLEQKLNVSLLLPEIADEQLLNEIDYAHDAVRHGKVSLLPGRSVFEVEKRFAELALNAFTASEPITIAIAGRDPEKVVLLGVEIDLGCPVVEHKNIILEQACASQLESDIQTLNRETFSVPMVPFGNESSTTAYFQKWATQGTLPKEICDLLNRV